jgi:hypothetical protein
VLNYYVFFSALSRETGDELTKTTVRRGLEFDVTVHRLLPPTEIQAETVFSCGMEIPGTQFSLRNRLLVAY